MYDEFKKTYLTKLVWQTILIGLATNVFILIFAFLFFRDAYVIGTSVGLSVVGIISYLLYFKMKSDFGLHFLLLGYMGIFLSMSFTHLVVLPWALGFPIFLGVAILFFHDFKIRVLYLLACIIGCVLCVYKNYQFSVPETYDSLLPVSILITIGFLVCLFLISNLSNVFMERYRQELEANQKSILQKNKELEEYIESNIQLTQFAHIASHDLKAPIRLINSFSSLLKVKLGDKLNEEEQEYFEFIESNGQKMSNLIDDLLQYSKVNSQKLNISKINAQEIAEEVLTILRHQADDKNVKVKIVEPLPVLRADPIKIKRVFQNLISNAIKFSDKGEEAKVEIGVTDFKNKWKFFIKDNGIGIKNKNQDIFKPFTQLNPNSKYGGTGMGLSFCQKIIQRHGGEISFDSVPGKGSTFCFTIDKSL